MADLAAMGDPEAWYTWAARLPVSPGVHRPSTFSAALAALLPDMAGLIVIDAGSGAGLVTIAALTRGAARVVALDRDPHALTDTGRNVEAVLGADGRSRVSLWQADWSWMSLLRCDVTLVNPPQRPSRLLTNVAPDERHLHVGGGADGLDGIRTVLAHARSDRVLTTASSLLDPGPATIVGDRFHAPARIAGAEVLHDRSWQMLTTQLRQPVDIWSFRQKDSAHRP